MREVGRMRERKRQWVCQRGKEKGEKERKKGRKKERKRKKSRGEQDIRRREPNFQSAGGDYIQSGHTRWLLLSSLFVLSNWRQQIRQWAHLGWRGQAGWILSHSEDKLTIHLIHQHTLHLYSTLTEAVTDRNGIHTQVNMESSTQ